MMPFVKKKLRLIMAQIFPLLSSSLMRLYIDITLFEKYLKLKPVEASWLHASVVQRHRELSSLTNLSPEKKTHSHFRIFCLIGTHNLKNQQYNSKFNVLDIRFNCFRHQFNLEAHTPNSTTSPKLEERFYQYYRFFFLKIFPFKQYQLCLNRNF